MRFSGEPGRVLLLTALGFALLAPPAIRVKVSLRPTGTATGIELSRVEAGLRKGLYADSLIVYGHDSLVSRMGAMPTDSAGRANRVDVYILRGTVDLSGDTITVESQVLNIVARPIGGLDRVRGSLAQIDSLVVEQGRRHAAALAKLRR